MKASELRLGNLVTIDNPKAWTKLKGLAMIVKSIENKPDAYFPKSSGTVSLLHKRDEYNQFDEFIAPIPLSAEWLERFGFGKSDEHEMGHNHRDDFHFYYDYHFKRFRIESGHASKVEYHQVLDIQYVHQLQNLYYSLTGKDLELKS